MNERELRKMKIIFVLFYPWIFNLIIIIANIIELHYLSIFFLPLSFYCGICASDIYRQIIK